MLIVESYFEDNELAAQCNHEGENQCFRYAICGGTYYWKKLRNQRDMTLTKLYNMKKSLQRKMSATI